MSLPLANCTVALVRPKFAENVGAVARAMANMGCSNLALVSPPGYDPARAQSLATVHAKHILASATLHDTLDQAVAQCHAVYGTTARTGGWRQGVLPARRAAQEIAQHLREGRRVGLVFGPEDKGLENDETLRCTRLICIPTPGELSSLNLAQAALLVLYECAQAAAFGDAPAPSAEERFITHQERETLLAALQETLAAIDYLRPENPDYWMLPVRRFLARMNLKRHEFNLLMGVCRQVRGLVSRQEAKKPS